MVTGLHQQGESLVSFIFVEVDLAQRPVTVEQTITAEMAANLSGYDPTWDIEILRNVTVRQTAEGMREIDRLFQAEQYEAAWRLAVKLENRLNEVAQLTHDDQMRQDVELMQRYQETLAEAVRQTENRDPQLTDETLPASEEQRPYRGSTESQVTPAPDKVAVVTTPLPSIFRSTPFITGLVVFGLVCGLIGTSLTGGFRP